MFPYQTIHFSKGTINRHKILNQNKAGRPQAGMLNKDEHLAPALGVTKIKFMRIMNLVTPTAGAKHELLFSELASEAGF